jgi:ectoine hydroxylase-related dioxygenase (phytanoyl-CoA dioxygenase family)
MPTRSLRWSRKAWLGPFYQMTAQLNVVNPGGAAQSPHRDYHLGFQTAEAVAQYPTHVHHFSPMLTLQGAIAHVDASIEAGPTLLLPHSQKYEAGYLATSRPEFRAYFDAHAVQLPLKKGDMLFFSPALFHAAGTNRTTDVKRMVNLFRSPRPMAARWKASTAPPCQGAVSRSSGAEPSGSCGDKRHRRQRRRIQLPHQP